ncbi:MAG: hypothetical protein L0I76_33395, partial [Pseudonocardia sp.]|nr:hypothetical protein [Pseudonocardia sp.]
GRIRSSMKEIIGLVYNPEIEPDLMVELLPVMLWLENAVGYSTNRCAVACVTLQHAYATMGITARPVAVDLVVANERTGQRTLYGTPEPYWDGATFHGHCVLSLPASGRFIDPTVEQYPELRRYRLGPICGKLIAAQASPEQLAALRAGGAGIPPGTHLGVRRNDLMLLYTTAGEEFHDVITAGATMVDNQADLERAARVLAAQALLLLADPEVIDRARTSPHPHLRVLLDRFAGAAFVDDDRDEPLIRLRDDATPRTLAEVLQPPPAPPPTRPRPARSRPLTATRPKEIPSPRERAPATTEPAGSDTAEPDRDGASRPARRGLLQRLRDALTGGNHR